MLVQLQTAVPSAPNHRDTITMDGSSMTLNLDKYRARFNDFRAIEEEREKMLKDLLSKYEELQLKYRLQRDDFDNEVEARRNWQARAQNALRSAVSQPGISFHSYNRISSYLSQIPRDARPPPNIDRPPSLWFPSVPLIVAQTSQGTQAHTVSRTPALLSSQ